MKWIDTLADVHGSIQRRKLGRVAQLSSFASLTNTRSEAKLWTGHTAINSLTEYRIEYILRSSTSQFVRFPD